MKLKAIGVVDRKDNLGRSYKIIETTARDPKPRPCKLCRKNPREAQSSRCAECIALIETRKYNDDRLRRKISAHK